MGDMNYLASIIDARPKIYLDELQQELLLHRNIEVSISTISRALQRLAISRKKVSHEAIERNELLRATWQAEYGDIPAEYFVWLDEASVDDQTNQRRDGWAASWEGMYLLCDIHSWAAVFGFACPDAQRYHCP
jgi:hypothetical protein